MLYLLFDELYLFFELADELFLGPIGFLLVLLLKD